MRAGDILIYRVGDALTEGLLYAMILFSPWAFGTSQPWSIWIMNIAGYGLGGLLAIKLAIRWVKGYRPPRWDQRSPVRHGRSSTGKPQMADRLTAAVAVLTLACLAFCLISALNARATYLSEAQVIEYHPCIRWLPHSYDSGQTWFYFWGYLALACSFWALRDWLLGKSGGEERVQAQKSGAGASLSRPVFPARVRRLLWLLAINGALLGLESIAQRLEGSGHLLFLVKPRVNPGAESQFGPFAYRANAAAFFNLLWPVCLGFWWTLNRSAGGKQGGHHLVLICAAIMAACPTISTSRGGALVSLGILVVAAIVLASAGQGKAKHHPKPSPGMAPLMIFFGAVLTLAGSLGWKAMQPRMAQLGEGFEYREEMYAFARPMVADAPFFGTGPGTFKNLFEFYRTSPDVYWPAQLHNDWLETLITFGGVGSSLIILALVAVLLRWFAAGGIHGGRRFVILMWLALAGCLVHARFDFPFQMYSILFLFLTLCAVLFTLSRRA